LQGWGWPLPLLFPIVGGVHGTLPAREREKNMSQTPADKYVYFTVAILKDSEALEALKQDALKHHMIDQPGQLIALRLTEYYKMMSEGVVQPVVHVPAIINTYSLPENKERPVPSTSSPTVPASGLHAVPNSSTSTHAAVLNQATGKMRAIRRDEPFVATSPNADQNADEAADYWSTL
jgi:hypothetical protein